MQPRAFPRRYRCAMRHSIYDVTDYLQRRLALVLCRVLGPYMLQRTLDACTHASDVQCTFVLPSYLYVLDCCFIVVREAPGADADSCHVVAVVDPSFSAAQHHPPSRPRGSVLLHQHLLSSVTPPEPHSIRTHACPHNGDSSKHVIRGSCMGRGSSPSPSTPSWLISLPSSLRFRCLFGCADGWTRLPSACVCGHRI